MEKRVTETLRLTNRIGSELSDNDIAHAYRGSLSEAVARLEIAKADMRTAFSEGAKNAAEKLFIVLSWFK